LFTADDVVALYGGSVTLTPGSARRAV
jgi:hypothetical protein